MNQQDLKQAMLRSQPVALKPPEGMGGGIARVKVVETGLTDPGRPHHSHNHTRVRVEFAHEISAMVADQHEDEITILNTWLYPWDDEAELTFSTLSSRAQLREQYERLAAIAGITISGFNPISERVTIEGEEFQRLVYEMLPEQGEG